MSRIGKLPIAIPENVDVNSESGITVIGKFELYKQ
jgi:ribosomal protein L6P/L9E